MSFEQADVFWIDDPETFELLADSNRLQILELTLVPRSATEIAEAMDVPRTRLYHHIKLLEEAGIIAVADTRQAGAMTEKIYQAAAKSYQPSQSFLETSAPRQQAEGVMASLLGSTQADFVRAVEEGIVRMHDQPSHRTISLGRRFFRLTPQKLHAFIEDLEALFNRYEDVGDIEGAMPVGVLHVIHPSSRRLS